MHRWLRKSFRLSAVMAGVVAIAASISIFAASTGDTTADRELGQGDLTHSTSPSFVRASSLNLDYRGEGGQNPGITIDSKGHLYVVDKFSNRVLGWSDAATFANGDPAAIVIDQPDFFTTNNCVPNTLCPPLVATTDSVGNLYVSSPGAGNGADEVIEYPTPFSQSAPITGTVVASAIPQGGPGGIAVDSHGNLWVALFGFFSDGGLVEYDAPLNHPTTPSLTIAANCGSISATNLCDPYGLAVDAEDNLYVADSGANRVLEFFNPLAPGGGTPGTPGSAGDLTADVVIGQTSFTGSNTNVMNSPRGVTVDTHGNVYVADTNGSNMEEFDGPLKTGAVVAANLFIGGTGSGANGCGYLSAISLCSDAGIATDPSGNLYVEDNNNNRIIAYTESNPPRNGTGSRVLGQHDFVHNNANFVDASTVNPGYVAVDRNSSPNHIYVTDEPNNRVLGWKDAASFTNGAPADLVLGQPDFYTNTCNTGGRSASSICSTSGCAEGCNGTLSVTVDQLGNVWVGDPDGGNRRILEFDAPFSSGVSAGEAASVVVGQSSFTAGSGGVVCGGPVCPSGIALDSSGNLWAADFINNRVYEFNNPLYYSGSLPEPPSLVLGQGSSGLNFSGGGCNSGGVSADSLCGPAGVAVDTLGNIYVADTGNSRVLVYFNPLAAGGGTPGTPGAAGDVTADVVFGQAGDFTANTCNNGGLTALSLCGPQGLAIDVFGSLFVADALNNRVLGYAEQNFTPSNVTAGIEFGQGTSGTDFTSGGANSGGLSASSLSFNNGASGVASDAVGNLYVADSHNARVLGYNGPFSEPTATATPTPSPTPEASTPTPTPTAMTSTPTPTTLVSTATPTGKPTPTGTAATPTPTPAACVASTPGPTVPMPTPTPPPGNPVITSMSDPVLVGGDLTINGRNFSAKPLVNFFVATSSGPLNAGPLTPSSVSATTLIVPIPATVPLGQGFVSVEVIDTDTGYTVSNLGYALLQGSAAAGLPTILTIDGHGLAATSSDPSYATANVETTLAQGSAATLGGNGFDTANGVAVDVFCACSGGKLPTTFINPGSPGLTSTSITFTLPAGTPTGPGSIIVSNAGAAHSYTDKSEAVSVPIGARLNITSITQSGSTITVNGSGFSTLTVINLFNTQAGGVVVNLGGFGADGKPNIPLTIVSSTQFTFTKPVGAAAGASFIQAFNPPFVPFTSTGNDPCAAFILN